jgi:putative endonuclease
MSGASTPVLGLFSGGILMAWEILKRIRCLFKGPHALRGVERPLNKVKGVTGELEAYRFLRQNGYRIVARNYRKRFGEVDLIGWDKDVLVFVEVKTRLSGEHGRPEEAVTRSKQKQIRRVASEYRASHRLHDINYRFDVISIQKSGSNCPPQLIKGAFKDFG